MGALASGRLGKHTVSSALRTRKLSPIEGRPFAHAGAGPESHTVPGARDLSLMVKGLHEGISSPALWSGLTLQGSMSFPL